MKKIILLILILFLTYQPSYSVEADDSVDELIKKQFNTESNLPSLPKTSPKSVESKNFLDTGISGTSKTVQSTTSSSIDNIPKVPQKTNKKAFKVNRWRKIKAKLTTPVSDYSKVGKQVTFETLEPFYSLGYEIPKGTKITGTVVKSHRPQLLGNGGLVSVKPEYVYLNGNSSYIEGNIVNLNHKLVFFNNIKGKSGYTKGISRAMKPGKTFYGKTLNLTKKMINGKLALLSPVVYLPGALFLAADAAVSPFVAIFSKGENIYIKNDTQLTIKLSSPAKIEY